MSTASVSVATAVKSALSDKFVKDLNKFYEWAKANEYVAKERDDGNIVDWNDSLISDFKEPSRNKLEVYLQKVLEKYHVTRHEEAIEDNKFFAKEFKESKTSKKGKTFENKNKKEKEISTSQEVIETSQFTETSQEVIETSQCINDIDTSDFSYMDTLEWTSQALVKAFGNPIENPNKLEHNRYEWKMRIKGTVYSIYDWKDDSEFDNITWHIGRADTTEEDIEFLGSYVGHKKAQAVEPKKAQAVEPKRTKPKKEKSAQGNKEETVEGKEEVIDDKKATERPEIDFNDLEEIDFDNDLLF